jgi:cobalt/nickel transport system permease protein
VKFLATVAFIVSVSLMPVGSFVTIGLAWLLVVGLAALSRIGPLRPARRAFLAAPFILAALPLVFTRSTELLGSVQLGPLTLTISGQGLREFATIALKSWVSVQAALVLAFTTPVHELIDGLRQLHLPRIMVAIISFMYRYLAVLSEEATRMARARAARSASVDGRGGGSLAWRARVTGSMVGSLFLRSYERAERIYAAMRARGFEGEVRHLHTHAVAPAEIVALVVVAATCIALVAASIAWLPG